LQARNVIITFTVSGLWHGANWTFVVWGLLNGLYFLPLMLAGRNRRYLDSIAPGRLLPRAREVPAMLMTFSATLVAWVFFRSPSIGDAFGYLRTAAERPYEGLGYMGYLPLLLACGLLLGVEWLQRERQYFLQIDRFPRAVRWGLCYLVLALILVFGAFRQQEFIYFQF
jgi:hypothetical protein